MEHLCRYVARPAVCDERLTLLGDGRVAYALKTPWNDGTTTVILTRGELMTRLAMLVPRPRSNLVRYHGVFAPASKLRKAVVAEAASVTVSGRPRTGGTRSRNYTWAELMRRVWEVDVLECPKCGGPMKIVAAVTSPDGIRGILRSLGKPTRAPEHARARPPPDDEWLWSA